MFDNGKSHRREISLSLKETHSKLSILRICNWFMDLETLQVSVLIINTKRFLEANYLSLIMVENSYRSFYLKK